MTLLNLRCDAVYVARMQQQKPPSRIALLAMWLAFVVITVGGGKLVTKAFGWDSTDYADLSATTDSVVRNMFVPLLLATMFVVILVTALKWWRPVIVDDRPVPRWMVLFPVFIIAISIAATDWNRLGDMGASYFMALAAATLIVGFNEEIMTRTAERCVAPSRLHVPDGHRVLYRSAIDRNIDCCHAHSRNLGFLAVVARNLKSGCRARRRISPPALPGCDTDGAVCRGHARAQVLDEFRRTGRHSNP
jgi:energy-converting hydrogenase Eha subunit A